MQGVQPTAKTLPSSEAADDAAAPLPRLPVTEALQGLPRASQRLEPEHAHEVETRG